MVKVTTHLNHTYRVDSLELGGEITPASDIHAFKYKVADTVYEGVFHAIQQDGTDLLIPGRDVRIVSITRTP